METRESFTASMDEVSEKIIALLEKTGRADENTTKKILKLEEEVKNLKNLIQFSLKPLVEKTNKELEVTKKALSDVQENQTKLEEIIQTVQNDNDDLKKSLTQQCSYSVSLGATMGSLFWRSTSVPAVVNLIMEMGKLDEFLSLAGTTIDIFARSLNTFPAAASEEIQFISSVFGIITNLATSESGLRKLTTEKPKREILEKILLLLPEIYEKAEEDLRKIMFLLLSNVCSLNDGIVLVRQVGEPLLQMVASAALQKTSPQLQIASLFVLQTIVRNLDDYSYYQILKQTIPKHLLETWQQDSQIIVRHYITNIINSYEIFETRNQSGSLKHQV